MRVALEQPGGRLVWQRPTVSTSLGGALEVDLPRPSPGVGLVVSSPTSGTFGPAVVRTAQGRSYAAAGVLQDALATAQWTFDGDRGPLAYYTNERARPLLTLRGVAGAGTGGASVRARSGARLDPTSALVSSPRGVAVIRAVAPIPGWSATWRPSGATATRNLAVRRSGVVQAVDVPAGRGVLTWLYSAPGLNAGALVRAGRCPGSGGAVAVAGAVGPRQAPWPSGPAPVP